MCSEVSLRWYELRAGVVLPYEGLGQDNDVVALAEWISEVCDGLHDDFSDVGKRLTMVVAAILPLGNVVERFDFFDVKSSALGAHADTAKVNPNILCNNAVVDFFPAARVVHVLVVELNVTVVH